MVCKGIVYVYERLTRFILFNGVKWCLFVYSGDELLFSSSHFTRDTLSREWSTNFKEFSGDLLKVTKYYRSDLVFALKNDFDLQI